MAHEHISDEELAEVRDFIIKELSNLKDEVKLVTFLDNPSKCHYCGDLKAILDLIGRNVNKVKLEYHRLSEEIAKDYGIKYAPTVVLEKGNKRNIRYIGVPGGYEFPIFIETIRNLSNNQTKVSISSKNILTKIKVPVNIKILVTLSCPYCPYVARISNNFAIENNNIISEIIDVGEIEEEAIKYDVQAVPKIVINEKIQLLGAQPENRLLQAIIDALDS